MNQLQHYGSGCARSESDPWVVFASTPHCLLVTEVMKALHKCGLDVNSSGEWRRYYNRCIMRIVLEKIYGACKSNHWMMKSLQ
jgi:hypothetical protein